MPLQQIRIKENKQKTLRQQLQEFVELNKKKVVFGSIIFVLLILTAFLGLSYLTLLKETNNDNQQNAQVAGTLVEKVARLTVIPEGDPTIATVEDIETLETESPLIYKDAQNGDIVLIYSKKMYIYRESEDKIINIVPIANETK